MVYWDHEIRDDPENNYGHPYLGHLYLLAPLEGYLVRMPMLSKTKDGGNAPATYF